VCNPVREWQRDGARRWRVLPDYFVSPHLHLLERLTTLVRPHSRGSPRHLGGCGKVRDWRRRRRGGSPSGTQNARWTAFCRSDHAQHPSHFLNENWELPQKADGRICRLSARQQTRRENKKSEVERFWHDRQRANIARLDERSATGNTSSSLTSRDLVQSFTV